MAITSLDSLMTALGAGQKNSGVFQKAMSNGAASAAGRSHELFTATGIPTAGSFTGTAGVATVMTAATQGALNVGAADVSPSTKHLLTTDAFSPTATVVPARLILVDMLLYYPALVVTGTATTLNNTATLTRYTTGEGVMAVVAVQSALGATQPALTFSYTDQAGNTGNTALAMTSPVASAPVSTLFLNNGGMYLPLATTDTGIRKLDSYTLATGTTGTVSAMLVKPLAEFPIYAINTSTKVSYAVDVPSLPIIQANACLGFLIVVGGAAIALSSIQGSIEAVWG